MGIKWVVLKPIKIRTVPALSGFKHSAAPLDFISGKACTADRVLNITESI